MNLAPTKRKPVYIIVGLIVALGLIIGLRVRSNAAVSNQKAGSKAALTVSLLSPQVKQWPVTISAGGNIAAWQEAVIGAETGGLRITALRADVGDWVRRGQVVAELSRATTEAELRRCAAAVASAKASLSQARSNAARARLIKGSGAISDQQVTDYLIAEQTAQAALEQAQAQLESQRVTLSQTSILAVDDGYVTARSAQLGQVVAAGSELFRIERQGRLEWRAEVDAQQLGRVKAGDKVELNLPGGKTISGTVRQTAPTVSTSTNRANVFVTLGKDSGARAGMFASGALTCGAKQVLTVPEAAVVLRDGNSYVFEIGAASHVIRRSVSVGQHRDGLVEITGGLEPQARIVAAGGAFLSDGDLVRVSGAAQ